MTSSAFDYVISVAGSDLLLIRSLEQAQALAPKLCSLPTSVIDSLALRTVGMPGGSRAWVLEPHLARWIERSAVQ